MLSDSLGATFYNIAPERECTTFSAAVQTSEIRQLSVLQRSIGFKKGPLMWGLGKICFKFRIAYELDGIALIIVEI